MDAYKEIFYATGVPGYHLHRDHPSILLVESLPVCRVCLTPPNRKEAGSGHARWSSQVHGSIAGDKGYQEVHEQVPGNIPDKYGAVVQQPSGTLPLSRGWENVRISTRRNAEEHSVEPFVRENAERLQGQGDRHTKDNDGQRSRVPHDDSAGVPAEGGHWPNAEK